MTLLERLRGIITRELQNVDSASKAGCLGEPQLKSLEVIAKLLKAYPDLAEEEAPEIIDSGSVESALALVNGGAP